MQTKTMLLLKPLCLVFLPLILSAPVSAKPHAKARRTPISRKTAQKPSQQALSIHQQFAAKDATITELRRQIRALTGQVAELQARVDDMWPASTPDLGVLTREVQDYDRLLTDARADAVEAQKNHALQQAVGGADQRRFASKESAELAAMKKSLLQAQGLYRKVMASPLYESHFYETDPAIKASEIGHSLAFDTVGEAVHLRFIQPR